MTQNHQQIMLSSLEIQNYRNFKHLRIEKLERVNLIIGKNNTGKTSLLEAVIIFITQGNIIQLFKILDKRREFFDSEEVPPQIKLHSLANLFINRKAAFTPEEAIKISSVSNNLSIRLSKYVEIEVPTVLTNAFGTETLLETVSTKLTEIDAKLDGKLRLESKIDNEFKYVSLSRSSLADMSFEEASERQQNNFQFVSAGITDDSLIADLWQKTQLTDSEEEVVKALRLLEPDIQRVSFKRNGDQDYAIVKLKNINEPVSLRSMGDGINRILAIILAMVNCQNGYLLIDEFDNGLHVSVQKQLWEIVFELANRLNIQVFATTHSYDCIDAFSEVLGSGKYAESDGLMVRLDNWQDNIEATIYEAKDIFNTTRLQIDPR
ncbi:MAG: DUF2813 domain-containing protein [Runella slithyformis]|nr:MAG: DUF2813 domain-containing protein [Runella slithyformis]TAE95320.1 MAG: DUF2813 domain-containing protein [Runella slithyformis]TAF44348.1 MAG: DUF2813 domain-containing protein [Runella slithyformis]TAF80743.1 MAG: DUF2813 domain-containing protein [Runella slithyformis]